MTQRLDKELLGATTIPAVEYKTVNEKTAVVKQKKKTNENDFESYDFKSILIRASNSF